jgi:hypothetical protein
MTTGLLIAATLLNGFLAGFNLDRSIVHNAAWHQLGPLAWADYSQHADLAVRGAILYPFLGIGGAFLSVAAAISFLRNEVAPRSAALPIYAGALLTISGLLVTTEAAPYMLSMTHLAGDSAGLQRALDGFVFWSNVRSWFQIVAFFMNLWSLATILEPSFSRNLDPIPPE